MQKVPITFLVGLLFFCSCAERKKTFPASSVKTEKSQQVQSSEFQSILDSAKVKGAIVLYDLLENGYYSNDFEWAKTQRLPASTYKIPNSIIALETGVVENDSILFKWNGEPRGMKIWEQDLIFKDAFHFSCVPCYQDVARRIGAKRMNQYLNKLNYGAMDVDSTNIDVFWLEGRSRISQLQQINFLKRFYKSELKITERTETLMKKLMVIEENELYSLSGKTGWATRNGHNNGWFVGYLESSENTYFFATNIEPLDGFDMQGFSAIRKQVTFSALRQMGIIE